VTQIDIESSSVDMLNIGSKLLYTVDFLLSLIEACYFDYRFIYFLISDYLYVFEYCYK
jgi:hypothetical protein